MKLVSETSGTRRTTTGSSVSRDAAKIGREAFGPADIDGSPQRKTSMYDKLLHSGLQLGDGFYTFKTPMQPQRAPERDKFPDGFSSPEKREGKRHGKKAGADQVL